MIAKSNAVLAVAAQLAGARPLDEAPTDGGAPGADLAGPARASAEDWAMAGAEDKRARRNAARLARGRL